MIVIAISIIFIMLIYAIKVFYDITEDIDEDHERQHKELLDVINHYDYRYPRYHHNYYRYLYDWPRYYDMNKRLHPHRHKHN